MGGNHVTLTTMYSHNLQVVAHARTSIHQVLNPDVEICPVIQDKNGMLWETTPLTLKDITDIGCDVKVVPDPDETEIDHIETKLCAAHKATVPISRIRQLIDQDDITDTVSYRCPECSSCLDCKKTNKEIATGIENSVGQLVAILDT